MYVLLSKPRQTHSPRIQQKKKIQDGQIISKETLQVEKTDGEEMTPEKIKYLAMTCLYITQQQQKRKKFVGYMK